MFRVFIIFISFCLLSPICVAENFKISEIFTDNMVLQNGQFIKIWGKGSPGKTIKLNFAKQQKETKITDRGLWECELEPMKICFEPQIMRVSQNDNNKPIILKNILIGEVWLAGGQSNMAFPLLHSSGAKDEMQNANFPEIRFINITQSSHPSKTRDAFPPDKWEVLTPSSSKNLSAISYYFAKELYNKLKIPIGIVSCNHGGTNIQTWMSRDALQKIEIGKKLLDPFDKKVKSKSLEQHEKGWDDYIIEFQIYREKVKEWTKNGKKGSPFKQPPMPDGPFCLNEPTVLFNSMLKKIIPYGIKGFIFYQGESNTANPEQYAELFPALIQDWRQQFQRAFNWFIFVQLPGFEHPAFRGKDNWARLRQIQYETWKYTINTGMVVSTDYGSKNDIHPPNKKPIGERLAAIALYEIYKKSTQNPYSPIAISASANEGIVTVKFSSVNKTLMFKDGNKTGFEIKDKTGSFKPAEASIEKDILILHNPQIKDPSSVRYNWSNYPEGTMCDQNGLPTAPFILEIE